MRPPTLTTDQAADILDRYQRGEAVKDIAARYNVSSNTIRAYCRRAGTEVRSKAKALDAAEVLAGWNQGLSVRALRRRFAVKDARIVETLRAAGIEPEDRRGVFLTSEQQAELLELNAQGWTAAALADRYGCSRPTVLAAVRRLGGQPRKTGRPRYLEFTAEHIKTIKTMATNGASQAVIGEAIGTSQVTVSRIMREHGITARRVKPTGSDHPAWKGGRIEVGGYVLVYVR